MTDFLGFLFSRTYEKCCRCAPRARIIELVQLVCQRSVVITAGVEHHQKHTFLVHAVSNKVYANEPIIICFRHIALTVTLFNCKKLLLAFFVVGGDYQHQ